MYEINEKWKNAYYDNNVPAMLNLYINEILINPDYIVDFSIGQDLLSNNKVELGRVTSKHIEFKIYKSIDNYEFNINTKTGNLELIENNGICDSKFYIEENKLVQEEGLTNEITSIRTEYGLLIDGKFEFIPIGIFTVESMSEDDNILSIKANDYMMKLKFPYDGSNLSYPITLKSCLKDISKKFNIKLESDTFLNEDNEIAVYDTSVKAIDYISYISEQAGGFALINRKGELAIRKYGDSVYKLDLELFGNFKWGEKFKCSRVKFEDGIRDFSFGDTKENSIYINPNNMYIVNKEQIKKIYNELVGMEIYGFNGEAMIDPAIDVGDFIEINGRYVLFQYDMSLNGRFFGTIKSEINPKSKEETTKTKISQQTINRRIQSTIDQQEAKIDLLGSEVTNAQQKVSEFELTVDSIKSSVSKAIDLTNSVMGTNPIILTDCMAGELQYLSIQGDNIFDSLYPNNGLLPNNNLLPYGNESLIIITNVETGNKNIYDLKLKEPLRKYNDEIGDKFIYDVINDNKEQKLKSYVIRKVGIDNQGKKYLLPEEQIVEVNINIELLPGTNIIDLVYPNNAAINAIYIKKNEYTKYFTSIYQVEALIEVLSNRIALELKEKLDNKDLIARINMAILGKDDAEIPEEIEKTLIQIFADILEVDTTYWKLSRQGRMIAKEGEIAGFDFSETGFKKEIDGTYEYTLSDVISALEHIQGNITLPDALIDLYDIDNDGEVTVIDVRRMMLIIEGKYENTKKVSGTVSIKPNDASNTFSVKVDDIVKTVIGLFNIYAYSMRCSNFYIGDYDVLTNIFQGIQINEETKQIKITRGNNTIIIGMDEQDRCTIQPSTGTIVCPDANVEAVNFHAGGGRCMHSTNMTHYYSCNWTGNQLQFFVDNVNVGTLSDERLKTDIEKINSKILKAIKEVELKEFKLLNRFGRKSFGIIAQDLISAFKLNGLNIWDYNLITQAQYELSDKTLYYIVDYEQFLILKNKCFEIEISNLNTRISKIERMLGIDEKN